MALRLEVFVSDMQEKIMDFRNAYIKKHEENPEQYPLTMIEYNEWLWYEFFNNFLDGYDV